MKKKILSLVLALVMSLGLAAPVLAVEASSTDGLVTYEFSNEPIGTVEVEGQMFFVVPDDTTVSCKTTPNSTIVIEYWGLYVEDGQVHMEGIYDIGPAEGGKLLAGKPAYAGRICRSEVRESVESELHVHLVTESTAKNLGLAISPYDPEKTPFEGEKIEVQPVIPSTDFSDVSPDAYYAEAVVWAVKNGIAVGTGNNKFSPDADCIIPQILTFLWRAYGEPEHTTKSNPFGLGHPIPAAYMNACVWAYDKGMIASQFDDASPCTRGQAMLFMWQAAGCPEPSKTAAFSDVPANSTYAQAVSWAVEKGITSGVTTTKFDPNGACSRGQIMTFLYRNLA